MTIRISPELKEHCPKLILGCISAKITYKQECPELWAQMDDMCKAIEVKLPVEGISELPNVVAARKAYRSCGKDPARYRLSSEALLRRVVKGKGIYKVNNIVDINNLVSMKYHFSIGAFDREKILFPVEFRIGRAGEPYVGIGRGDLNIEDLPVLADEKGPFGSPTSDSERTKIHPEMTQLLFCILSFAGEGNLATALDETVELLKVYGEASEVKVWRVD